MAAFTYIADMEKGSTRCKSVDKKLCQRICQYVDIQPKQRYINTDEVITFLQNKYPEYGRKKKKSLYALVQKPLQEILVERYGPQNKRSRIKSIVLENDSGSSSSDNEVKDVTNSMPIMTANSLNNTMRNVYQRSQSQPCSPSLDRKELGQGSQSSSPKYLRSNSVDKSGFFIDRKGKRNNSVTSCQLPADFQSLTHSSMEDYISQRKELSSDGLISDEIIEESEDVEVVNSSSRVDSNKSNEVYEIIQDKIDDSIRNMEKIEKENKKDEKKYRMSTKTVVEVHDLISQRKLSVPVHKSKIDSHQVSKKRRESAPIYARKGNHNSPSRSSRRAGTESGNSSWSVVSKARPNVEGVSNDEEDKASRRSSLYHSSRRKSSKQTERFDREYRNIVQTAITFSSIAGCDEVIEEISQLLLHLAHPEIYSTLGVAPTQGILLHGPPGCGKTLLANAIAGEMKLPFFSVTGTELVSGLSGESEHNIRSLFRQARLLAPSILFIDELDSICGKREDASKDMERRIITQVISSIDDLAAKGGPYVLLLAATNRPESIDASMRRAGRLDREICLGIPNERQRISILTKLCSPLKLDDTFDFYQIAHNTPGYVAADLVALVREASLCSISRSLQTLADTKSVHSTSSCDSQLSDTPTTTSFRSLISNNHSAIPFSEGKLESINITLEDFLAATKKVQPSAKREGFATVPNVTWQDVGALDKIRDELTMSILAPVKYPEKFEALGLTRSQGILIAGPPGCGKTLLAKAVANESGINFISVKGPELLNMYVGESERAVRTVFQRARASAPCVIFFDEIDSLVPKRSSSENNSQARVVNQLLTEMDGLESRKNVFIIGATNRLDIIDPAMLRPGRLDKTVFVSLPSLDDRIAILKTIIRNDRPKIRADVHLKEIAELSEGFTGADLSALVREASVLCLKENMLSGKSGDNCIVSKEHFAKALKVIKPSVSLTDRLLYEQMAKQCTEGVA